MKIVIDMNLSPDWVEVFRAASYEAYHWQSVGDPSATDDELLEWAANNRCVVFTHDLDFSALLAVRKLNGPSVIQLRGQETSPSKLAEALLRALSQLSGELERGALVSIDVARTRARILPFPTPPAS